MEIYITLFLSALILLFTVLFNFRKRILGEVHLIRRTEIWELLEKFPPSLVYHFSLTSTERNKIISDLIEQMKLIQKKVADSIFAKYFVDLSDYISLKEKQLSDDSVGALYG